MNSTDSLRANRDLTAREGIFAGISSRRGGPRRPSGSPVEIDDGDIVCLLPDGGWKYLSHRGVGEDLETAEKGVAESLWW